MKAGFLEKILTRIDQETPEQIQTLLERLVKEKGFLENVFESLQEGVLILGSDGEISFMNRAAGVFFGAEASQMIGKEIEHLIQGLDWNDLHRGGASTVSRDLEIFYPENRFLNFYLSPIDDELKGEDSLGYVMLIRDITKSRAETAETIETESLNALTLLAAGVAHEIGNPLNSLNIHLQLLNRKIQKLPEETQNSLGDHLSTAQQEIQRLDHILKDFLHAVRPTSPVRKQVDLHQILEEVLKSMAPELAGRDCKIALHLDEFLPALELDAGQIQQALFNLIKNASQATPLDTGLIQIKTISNDYEVKLQVIDNGAGISPEIMGTLFEPYQSTKQSGNGLGLLIVRRILREHGGEIEVESEKGSGTTITLYFPRKSKQVRYLGDETPPIELESL